MHVAISIMFRVAHARNPRSAPALPESGQGHHHSNGIDSHVRPLHSSLPGGPMATQTVSALSIHLSPSSS
jgi:hypothetical protein